MVFSHWSQCNFNSIRIVFDECGSNQIDRLQYENWIIPDLICTDSCLNASAVFLSMMIPMIRGIISGFDSQDLEGGSLQKGMFLVNKGTLKRPTSIIPFNENEFS